MSKKKRKKIDAGSVANKNQGGLEFTHIRIPDGVQLMKIEKAGLRRFEIISFEAGEGNPECDQGDEYFERTYYAHRGMGAEGKEMYICPAKNSGNPCPVCELRTAMTHDPDVTKEDADALKPKKRQLWNILDVEDIEAGIQLYDVSFYNFGKQLYAEVRNGDDGEYNFFADPEDGMTVKVSFAEKHFSGNSFYEAESINFKDRAAPLDVGDGQCLDDLIIELPYDKLKSILMQTTPEPAAEKKEDEEKPGGVTTADEVGISPGCTVIHGIHGACMVAKVSKDGTSLTLESDDGETYKAIGCDEVELPGKPDVSSSKPKKDKKKKKKKKKKDKHTD